MIVVVFVNHGISHHAIYPIAVLLYCVVCLCKSWDIAHAIHPIGLGVLFILNTSISLYILTISYAIHILYNQSDWLSMLKILLATYIIRPISYCQSYDY